MPAAARPGAGDRQRGAGAAPVELFGRDHLHLALGVGGRALHALESPEALPARLFDDLPGGALLASCLRGGGADHLAGERPALLLVRELLVVQCEIHWFLPRRGPIDWSVSQSPELYLTGQPAGHPTGPRVAFAPVSADRPINADVPAADTAPGATEAPTSGRAAKPEPKPAKPEAAPRSQSPPRRDRSAAARRSRSAAASRSRAR